MAFPLATVLSAAPGLISAAADVIRILRERKKKQAEPQPDSDKMNELVSLIEQQATIIEELAVNNRNMALAVRNNRILSALSLCVSLVAVMLALL